MLKIISAVPNHNVITLMCDKKHRFNKQIHFTITEITMPYLELLDLTKIKCPECEKIRI